MLLAERQVIVNGTQLGEPVPDQKCQPNQSNLDFLSQLKIRINDIMLIKWTIQQPPAARNNLPFSPQ